ncbi:hypothetical protein FRC07_008107 [Ceratobasidium sp. 392]|nr:hypothetical protein FRC07_008107 [Ceratobasidium sp. 392]
MHTSNEEDFRLATTDADRFLAMHRLLELKSLQRIDDTTYIASQQRLEAAILKDGTRQGLRNLLRSKDLADAISEALQLDHIRQSFNAGTWGKKLVKGRLYAVAVGLIKEMVEQSRLLQGTWTEVPVKPFQLAAKYCTWAKLETGVVRKDHAWQQLEGGAQAALQRAMSRPPGFVHLMNPLASEGWMLDRIMVHMIAGSDVLNRYTAARADDTGKDHPIGIITTVLEDQLRGKESNYPNKILYSMWQNRKALLQSLEQKHIQDAIDTTAESYQALILDTHCWWKLMSLFKMRQLRKGLNLNVPKAFPQPAESTCDLQTRAESQQSCNANSPLDPLPTASSATTSHTYPAADLQAQDSLPMHSDPLVDASQQHPRRPSTPDMHVGFQDGTVEPHGHNTRRKRARVLEDEENQSGPSPHTEDESLSHLDNGSSELPLTRESTVQGLRSYSHLVSQLQGWQNSVPRLQADETRALGDLLEQLVALQGTGYLPRVVTTLNDQIQPLTKRARRANMITQGFEQEDEEASSDGHHEAGDARCYE